LASLVVVGALHLGIIYALLLGLAPNIVSSVPPPLDIRLFHTAVKPPPPPTPIAVTVRSPAVVEVPTPAIQIAPEPNHASVVAQGPLVASLPHDVAALPASVFVPAQAIAASHTIPQYPALAVRLGQEGDVRLALTIAETGDVVEARVVASSGHALLDAAAISWVESHWRYEPAKRDGKPVGAVTEAVVTFRLATR
jgi:protein TonB